MPVPPPCPFPPSAPVLLATLRAVPAPARALLPPMADAGEPFQATDALPPGPHPPFRRFYGAQRTGCALTVTYEQGGIAHTWRTLRLQLRDGRWTALPPVEASGR